MRWEVFNPGSTSSRSSDLINFSNIYMESLKRFFDSNPSNSWASNQAEFFEQMVADGIINSAVESAESFRKTARQKTSLLVTLGLLNNQRQRTWLGELYFSGESHNLISRVMNNQQLAFLIGILNVNRNNRYPYKELLRYLSSREDNTANWIDTISNYIIINNKTDDELYEYVRNPIINNIDDFEEFVENRKGRNLNLPYYELFKSLIQNQNDIEYMKNKIWEFTSSKFKKHLAKIMFGTTIKREVNDNAITFSTADLLVYFLKAKRNALIEEYSDMSKRALLATGQFMFEGEVVTVSSALAELVNEIGLNNDQIENVNTIFRISPTEENINIERFESTILDRRNDFELFLDSKLPLNRVASYLRDISKGIYSNIKRDLQINSNDATVAEWLVTIAFHYISGRTVDFRDAWKGNLGIDNLPIYHATGGMPDALFVINNYAYLVETTIQTGQQQTTNEIAPIYTHLQGVANIEKMAILYARRIPQTTQEFANHVSVGGVIIKFSEFWELANYLSGLDINLNSYIGGMNAQI